MIAVVLLASIENCGVDGVDLKSSNDTVLDTTNGTGVLTIVVDVLF